MADYAGKANMLLINKNVCPASNHENCQANLPMLDYNYRSLPHSGSDSWHVSSIYDGAGVWIEDIGGGAQYGYAEYTQDDLDVRASLNALLGCATLYQHYSLSACDTCDHAHCVTATCAPDYANFSESTGRCSATGPTSAPTNFPTDAPTLTPYPSLAPSPAPTAAPTTAAPTSETDPCISSIAGILGDFSSTSSTDARSVPNRCGTYIEEPTSDGSAARLALRIDALTNGCDKACLNELDGWKAECDTDSSAVDPKLLSHVDRAHGICTTQATANAGARPSADMFFTISAATFAGLTTALLR